MAAGAGPGRKRRCARGRRNKGGKFATKIDSVRLLAPTVAIADGTFEISNIAGGSRKGNISYVLVKSGDGWRIAASRSMVPTAAGPTPAK